MTMHSDDDLLRPTLAEADDALGFDEPWNPWSLVMLTFFAGLLAGGSLLALNFARLGMKGRLYPALAIVGVASIAIAGGMEWALASGLIPATDRDAQRTARWIVRAASCLLAIGLAALQRPRFRLFQMSGHSPGALLKPGLIAVVASIPVAIGLRYAFRALF
jgi:hypothetical protein